jgi:hypothetical protein
MEPIDRAAPWPLIGGKEMADSRPIQSKRRTVRYLTALAAGILLAGVAGIASAGVAGQASGAPRATDGGRCTTLSVGVGSRDPFRGVCRFLASRKGVVRVALYDHNTNTTYLLSTGNDTQYTASIVKVDILAKWLHNYQHEGVKIPDGIPYSIQYLAQRMIENSDNAAATGLFYFGGGCRTLTAFNELFPLPHTTVGCQTPTYYGWGNTTTTAADQVELMRIIAYGGQDHIVGSEARAYELQLMQNVEPDQRFGISCGPFGDVCDPPDYATPKPGVTVALKNGWKTLPTCTKPIEKCPWQVNSMGWVAGEGRNYVLAVLTTNDPVGTGNLYGFNYGISTIQGISKLIWGNLA